MGRSEATQKTLIEVGGNLVKTLLTSATKMLVPLAADATPPVCASPDLFVPPPLPDTSTVLPLLW